MNPCRLLIISIAFSLLVPHLLWAQVKHDANWCFGNNAGIDFSDTSNALAFECLTNNSELSASISDSSGNLLFYLSTEMNNYVPSKIYNASNNLIINGDSIRSYESCANCAIFLPNSKQLDQYFLFHIGPSKGATCTTCPIFHYSKIESRNSGTFEVIAKNEVISSDTVEERFAITKHANGRDWWLILHKLPDDLSCTQDFYIYHLTSNKINGPFIQTIGSEHCGHISLVGEMTFSLSGNKLVSGNSRNNSIDLFDFDRCTGQLSNFKLVDEGNFSFQPYSVAFSPNGQFIYTYLEQKQGLGQRLYQYEIRQDTFIRQLIWSNSNDTIKFGQLELAPDNKIYLSTSFGLFLPNNIYAQYNTNLSVIHQPDSSGLACDFKPFSFPLADSTRTWASLPNMPNYRLGPTTIYQAKAATTDTLVFCTDTTQKGLVLGVDTIPGVQYSWSPNIGLDNDSIAQPFLDPDSSRWYYVNLTDTSIQYSCQSRVDSVFVHVKACLSTSITRPFQDSGYQLFPNLLHGGHATQLKLNTHEQGRLELYNLSGQLMESYPLTGGTNHLMIDGAKGSGMYFYRVWVDEALVYAGKLVVVN